MTTAKWRRASPNSVNDFDLILINPDEVDFPQMEKILGNVESETHRGLTLSSRASMEFERWFRQPDTPLKSEAYVQLSNWFMTRSGDRHSTVATHCEELWDALFPCRPVERLSLPQAGRNHVVVPAEFERFWGRVLEAQGQDIGETNDTPAESVIKPQPRLSDVSHDGGGSMPEPLRATFDKDGLRFQVEGSPRSLADFLQMVSGWGVAPKT
jgi:hypothetical protein